MGDAPEGRSEPAPASDVADAKTATGALEGAEAPAVMAGAVSAGRAAQMLMSGAGGAPISPGPRARLTPGAALALQRAIGNRAFSRRMLMRDDKAGADEVEELPVPYVVDASGPNDAALKAADYLS